jgi:uncharacterized damage-inducible protein DinB
MKLKLLLLVLLIAANIATASDFKNDFDSVWERATEYTLKVVELMPAENYDFKATGDVGSFAGISGHIAGNLFWLTSKIIKDEENPVGKIDWSEQSREQIIGYLKQAFNYVKETVQNIDEEELGDTLEFGGETVNKKRIFWLMRDHMTHHRAQLIVYLRLNNIEPPRYVGW